MRTMLKSEIADLAEICFSAILQGEDPVALLEAKGYENPTETWYDIRRWMKSNVPAKYAGIPMKYRIELPTAAGTHKITQDGNYEFTPADTTDKKENEKEEPAAPVKPKKRGRPKGWKRPEAENAEEAPKEPQKPTFELVVTEVECRSFSFTAEDKKIRIIKKDCLSQNLILSRKEAEELSEIIMQAVVTLNVE